MTNSEGKHNPNGKTYGKRDCKQPGAPNCMSCQPNRARSCGMGDKKLSMIATLVGSKHERAQQCREKQHCEQRERQVGIVG